MFDRCTAYIFLVLLASALVSAQSGLPDATVASVQRSTYLGKSLTLRGKVVVQGASAPGESTIVILECDGKERSRVSSERDGQFAFLMFVPQGEADGDHPIAAQILSGCEIYAQSEGYTSDRVYRFSDKQVSVVQAETIVLHPLVADQAFAVSVNFLAAPLSAKTAFKKGRDQEAKGRWAASCAYFKKAIKAYPRFALAWLELGRSQARLNNFTDARVSFREAAVSDPHLLDAHVEMARLALSEKRWEELAEATSHIVQVSPDAPPKWWFLNGVANYNLGAVSHAEASVVRGLRSDKKHEAPQLEYLYGMILGKNGNYVAAAQHIRTYLTISPHASDAPQAQLRLAEFQKAAESNKPTVDRSKLSR